MVSVLAGVVQVVGGLGPTRQGPETQRRRQQQKPLHPRLPCMKRFYQPPLCIGAASISCPGFVAKPVSAPIKVFVRADTMMPMVIR